MSSSNTFFSSRRTFLASSISRSLTSISRLNEVSLDYRVPKFSRKFTDLECFFFKSVFECLDLKFFLFLILFDLHFQIFQVYWVILLLIRKFLLEEFAIKPKHVNGFVFFHELIFQHVEFAVHWTNLCQMVRFEGLCTLFFKLKVGFELLLGKEELIV